MLLIIFFGSIICYSFYSINTFICRKRYINNNYTKNSDEMV